MVVQPAQLTVRDFIIADRSLDPLAVTARVLRLPRAQHSRQSAFCLRGCAAPDTPGGASLRGWLLGVPGKSGDGYRCCVCVHSSAVDFGFPSGAPGSGAGVGILSRVEAVGWALSLVRETPAGERGGAEDQHAVKRRCCPLASAHRCWACADVSTPARGRGRIHPFADLMLQSTEIELAVFSTCSWMHLFSCLFFSWVTQLFAAEGKFTICRGQLISFWWTVWWTVVLLF